MWIRTRFAGVPADYRAVRTEAARALAPFDAIVPPIAEAATADTACLDRMRWVAPSLNRAHDIVRRFVESSLPDAVSSGRCVITHEAHVLDDRRLAVRDIGGICRLESVDRAVLIETVEALMARSATGLEARIEAAPGGLDDLRRWVANGCAAGLIVEGSSLGLTLLRDVTPTLLVGGSTHANSLYAIADEVAHRADLAHRHRCPFVFASPTAVHRLLEQAA